MTATGMLQVFLLIALSALSMATSIPNGLALPHGYGIDEASVSPMLWKGEIGGHYLELNGAIHEVYAQAQQIHPDIPDLEIANFTLQDIPKFTPRNDDSGSHSLQLRQSAPPEQGHFCWPVPGQPWGYTWQVLAWYSIQALADAGGYCCGPPGPGGCFKAVCTHNTAIWLCNDHPTGYCVECLFLADYAEYLTGECAIVPPYSSNYGDICGGQMFSPDQWNVVLQWDNTCGPA